MKTLPINFILGSFDYSQEKREGRVVLYLKTIVNKPTESKWFEAVVLCNEEGQEVFPAKTSWGILGETFSETEKDKAEKKYQDFVSEFGPSYFANHKVSNIKTEDHQVAAVMTEGQIINTLTDKQLSKVDFSGPKVRGRKLKDVDLKIPQTGTFTVREIADSCGQSIPFIHNRIKALMQEGKVKLVEKVKGQRGKKQLVLQAV